MPLVAVVSASVATVGSPAVAAVAKKSQAAVIAKKPLVAHRPGEISGTGTSNPQGLLSYHGGSGPYGVVTSSPKVYLIFYGTQWGTASTNSAGYLTFPTTTDPQQVAVPLQELYRGLGSNSEAWSRVMTQYCQGVASGSTTCPSSAPAIPMPSGGALGGVWYDNLAPAPSSSETWDYSTPITDAIVHFKLTSAQIASSQFVFAAPHGTHPDGFNPIADPSANNECGYHAADFGFGSPVPVFTDLPYDPDATNCGGQNTEGITMVASHEYAETLTDPFGNSWYNQGASNGEIGDECSWQKTYLGLGTGRVAVQKLWSNRAALSGSGVTCVSGVSSSTIDGTAACGSTVNQNFYNAFAVKFEGCSYADDASGQLQLHSVNVVSTGAPGLVQDCAIVFVLYVDGQQVRSSRTSCHINGDMLPSQIVRYSPPCGSHYIYLEWYGYVYFNGGAYYTSKVTSPALTFNQASVC